MKRERIVPIIIIAAVAIGAAGTAVYFAANPAVWQQTLEQLDLAQAPVPGLSGSGFIEAEEIEIAPVLAGRVAELTVAEGDDVSAGQVLARLEDALLAAQIEAAQAALATAMIEAAQARAGARPGQIRQAQAALALALAAREGTYQGWQDAIAMRDAPQQLEAQIVQARTQVAAGKAALDQAVALKDAAEVAHDEYWKGMDALAKAEAALGKLPRSERPPMPGVPLEAQLIPNEYWKAWVGVNAAGAQYDGARAMLANLYAMRDDPQQADALVDAARTQYESALAAVQVAQAQLDTLKAGATAQEIAIAQAQVGQAQAGLDTLLALRDKLTITTPVGGVVLEANIHSGELAMPGATMLKVGNLDEVKLTVYIPEDKLGQVTIAQLVQVSSDSFPGRPFTGRVVAIAQQAEFTPRNVQTQAERVNMVFGVELRVPNPDQALKPGTPADAVILTQEE
ncbi:MAG: efflux RND transporter periplasmic adaptor subunit [Thermoflexales bacterium]|nr:efflux RND transporter periplasmic adaptor subunit [Thermoflexales bacterium]